jgi:hypothetical protein
MFSAVRNAAVGAATLALAAGLSPSAQSAYTVTFVQQGPNVVAAGSGSFDLTDLTPAVGIGTNALVRPADGDVMTGAGGVTDGYGDIAGPLAFGSGGLIFADSGSGDFVGVLFGGLLEVPTGYSSGPLTDTATYDNQTFASLGVTPGTYVWTWGTGAHADSFTLQIGPAAAPEPASLTVLAMGLAGLGMALRTRRA